MSAPSKKRDVRQKEPDFSGELHEDEELADDDSEEDGMEEETMDQDGEEIGEQVQVDFEARNPEDHDFHGIRKLLQQVFLKANIDISELTDTLISQNYVGSVVKQVEDVEEMDSDDEDEGGDVFGIVTAVNITERKALDCVQQLKTMLLEKCAACAQQQRDTLAAILEDPSEHVGFLVNERFINLPPQMAVPFFSSLWKEIERAKQKSMPYTFSYLLMVCKTYQVEAAGPGGRAKKGKHKKQDNHQDDAHLLFVNAEEELFAQEASFKFSYSVKDERDTGKAGSWDDEEEALEPLRTVLLIPATRVQHIMTQVTMNYPP